MSTPSWPDQMVAEFTAMLAEGLPYAEIARRLGISKNAAIGKADRMGLCLPREGEPGTTIGRLEALNVFPPRQFCVFPVGDSGYCGQPVAIPGAPYCPTHMSEAYRPAQTKAIPAMTVNYFANLQSGPVDGATS